MTKDEKLKLLTILMKEYNAVFSALCWSNPQHTKTREKFASAYYKLQDDILELK